MLRLTPLYFVYSVWKHTALTGMMIMLQWTGKIKANLTIFVMQEQSTVKLITFLQLTFVGVNWEELEQDGVVFLCFVCFLWFFFWLVGCFFKEKKTPQLRRWFFFSVLHIKKNTEQLERTQKRGKKWH